MCVMHVDISDYLSTEKPNTQSLPLSLESRNRTDLSNTRRAIPDVEQHRAQVSVYSVPASLVRDVARMLQQSYTGCDFGKREQSYSALLPPISAVKPRFEKHNLAIAILSPSSRDASHLKQANADSEN